MLPLASRLLDTATPPIPEAQGWAGASEFLTHLPPDQGQIGGGWMMWALREATARAGYHTDAGRKT